MYNIHCEECMGPFKVNKGNLNAIFPDENNYVIPLPSPPPPFAPSPKKNNKQSKHYADETGHDSGLKYEFLL